MIEKSCHMAFRLVGQKVTEFTELQRTILADLAIKPNSRFQEIAARTGLPIICIKDAISKLKKNGSVLGITDIFDNELQKWRLDVGSNGYGKRERMRRESSRIALVALIENPGCMANYVAQKIGNCTPERAGTILMWMYKRGFVDYGSIEKRRANGAKCKAWAFVGQMPENIVHSEPFTKNNDDTDTIDDFVSPGITISDMKWMEYWKTKKAERRFVAHPESVY